VLTLLITRNSSALTAITATCTALGVKEIAPVFGFMETPVEEDNGFKALKPATYGRAIPPEPLAPTSEYTTTSPFASAPLGLIEAGVPMQNWPIGLFRKLGEEFPGANRVFNCVDKYRFCEPGFTSVVTAWFLAFRSTERV
jgi:hypothetical protein